MAALNLRIPDDLHRKMTKTAKGSYRSLNSEIIHRLQQSFEHKPAVEVVTALVRKARAQGGQRATA